MMSSVIKVIFPVVLISAFIYILTLVFANLFINYEILGQILVFIKSSMKSFDWLIPYQAQITVLSVFATVELGFFGLKVLNIIFSFFGRVPTSNDSGGNGSNKR